MRYADFKQIETDRLILRDIRMEDIQEYYERLFGDAANCGCYLACRLGRCAEAHTASVNVGAGNVDLEPTYIVYFVKLLAGVCIILNRESADVCHNLF